MKCKYILIPDPVLKDDRLNLHSKILFGIVFRLTQTAGYCWASNGGLAKEIDKDERSVQRWLKELIDCGYMSASFEGSTRKIYCVDLNYLGDIPVIPRQKIHVPTTENTRPHDTPVVGDIPVVDGVRLADALTHDWPDVQNNIMNNTSTVPGVQAAPTTKMSSSQVATHLPAVQQTLALRPAGYWEGKRHDFLQNQIFIEKFSIAKRIPPAATQALMTHFCDDLELRDDKGSADRLQSHFTHWYNKGINDGYILRDGTLKNQPTANPGPSHEQSKFQQARPGARERSADDILQQYGNDLERSQESAIR